MPHFSDLPYSRRYNSLRLLGYEYNSPFQLYALTLVTDFRHPLFADVKLAKGVLASLLSDETQVHMRVRAFTLMPEHLHLLAGVRSPDRNLSNLIGRFKSYTTQTYWKRSSEIVASNEVSLPSLQVAKSSARETRPLLAALSEWRATLRPEVVELNGWPRLRPEQFLGKRLWQDQFFDHVIRNDIDLRENLDYIAMNPVKAGYFSAPQFYPYTGFIVEETERRLSAPTS